MEDKPLSIESTKEEVAEYFVKNFKFEDIYFVFDKLTFDFLKISKYQFFSEEIKPPKLFIQDFDSIF